MSSLKRDSLDKFTQFTAKAADADRLAAWLQIFFTEEERHNLADRTELLRALLKGNKPQRQIAIELNISIAKITRGSNMLKQLPADVLDYLRKTLLNL